MDFLTRMQRTFARRQLRKTKSLKPLKKPTSSYKPRSKPQYCVYKKRNARSQKWAPKSNKRTQSMASLKGEIERVKMETRTEKITYDGLVQEMDLLHKTKNVAEGTSDLTDYKKLIEIFDDMQGQLKDFHQLAVLILKKEDHEKNTLFNSYRHILCNGSKDVAKHALEFNHVRAFMNEIRNLMEHHELLSGLIEEGIPLPKQKIEALHLMDGDIGSPDSVGFPQWMNILFQYKPTTEESDSFACPLVRIIENNVPM